MDAIGVIPARLQSSRLPRKLLLAETGRPLLQHTWEQASQAKGLNRLLVATDSSEIAEVVRGFGGEVVLTGEHPSGTDRIAEVVRTLASEGESGGAPELIVNIQGDEPEIDPAQIDLAIDLLRDCPAAAVSTLATRITGAAERDSPSCVKVVCGTDGRALYFSRATIPHVRDEPPDSLLGDDSPWLLHIGLYAWRSSALLQLAETPQTPLEQLEKLEQLRVLEVGHRIQVGIVQHRSVGIDTPEDYAQFVRRWKNASPCP